MQQWWSHFHAVLPQDPLAFLAIFYDWILACGTTCLGVHSSWDMWLSGSHRSTFTAGRLESMTVMIIEGDSTAVLGKMTWLEVAYLGAWQGRGAEKPWCIQSHVENPNKRLTEAPS